MRLPGREHLAVVFDEAPRRLLGVELEIVPADDLLRRFPEEPRRRRVDQHVAAVEVLDEDGVGRRLDHRPQDLIAVRQHQIADYSQGRKGGRQEGRNSMKEGRKGEMTKAGRVEG